VNSRETPSPLKARTPRNHSGHRGALCLWYRYGVMTNGVPSRRWNVSRSPGECCFPRNIFASRRSAHCALVRGRRSKGGSAASLGETGGACTGRRSTSARTTGPSNHARGAVQPRDGAAVTIATSRSSFISRYGEHPSPVGGVSSLACHPKLAHGSGERRMVPAPDL
jgi:hypothetical protein